MAHLGHMGRFNDDRLRGIGPALLYDAALRVAAGAEQLGIWGIYLEPENEGLEAWYADLGFNYLVPDPQRPRKPGDRARMFAALDPLLLKLKAAGADTF